MSRLQKGRSAALGQVQHIPGKSSPAVSKRLKKNTDILQQKSTKRWRPRSFLASEAQRGHPLTHCLQSSGPRCAPKEWVRGEDTRSLLGHWSMLWLEFPRMTFGLWHGFSVCEAGRSVAYSGAQWSYSPEEKPAIHGRSSPRMLSLCLTVPHF